MKKYLLALFAFTLVSVASNAQTSADTTASKNYAHHHRDFAMHGRHNNMQNLNLTDAQKQQLKAMHEDYRNKLSALEKNDNITLKEYHKKQAALEQDRKAKFESILTADQKNKIAMAKQQRSERMKMLSEKRLNKMKADLNLSDDQVAKIKDQHDNMMMQAKSIKENTSLTDTQKKEQLMQLRKTSKESMNNILTTDQLKKKEELRSDRMKEWKNKKVTKES